MSTEPTAAVRTCYRHPDRRAGVACQRCDRPICPDCMKTASVGFHCPECTRTGKQKVYTRANLQHLNRPLVTQVLIGLNALVFVAGLADSSRNAFAGRGGFIRDGGLAGPLVADGEFWRIITSGFLHAGLMHIAFNMLALFNIGSTLEPALGRLRFAAVYFTSLIAGSFGALLVTPDALTVGASGAVYGLLGALFVVARARGIDPWSSGLGGVLVLNLIFTFAIPGISIGGHVGGLAGGAASAWVLVDGARTMGTKQSVSAVGAMAGAAFVACLVVA